MHSNHLTPVRAAWALSLLFLAPGVLGFLPNPLVGATGMFETNAPHNLVHLATAVGFAVVARLGDRWSLNFMRAFAVVYLLVAVLGFVTLGGMDRGLLLGLIHINSLDNYLHAGLALAILGTSVVAKVPYAPVATAS